MSRAAAKRERPDIVTITLPDDARERLDALAAERGTSRSEVVRWLLAEAPARDVTITELRALVDAVSARVAALERGR